MESKFESLIVDIAKIFAKEIAREIVELEQSKPKIKEALKEAPNTPRFIPVNEWNNYHDYPVVNQLRWLIFNSKKSGISHCIRKVGRRVVIQEDLLLEWINNQEFKDNG